MTLELLERPTWPKEEMLKELNKLVDDVSTGRVKAIYIIAESTADYRRTSFGFSREQILGLLTRAQYSINQEWDEAARSKC